MNKRCSCGMRISKGQLNRHKVSVWHREHEYIKSLLTARLNRSEIGRLVGTSGVYISRCLRKVAAHV